MELIDLDLGNLEIESKTLGLQLQCSSSARIAPSAEDDNDELRRRLMQWSLNSNCDALPWFERGSNYHVQILLHFEDVIGVGEDAAAEEVSRLLQDAEMWQQIHVSPTSIETTPDPENAITVHLKYNDTERSKRQLHKLAVDVPFYDIHPPASTYVANVGRIQLDMRIRRRPRRQRRMLERTTGNSLNISTAYLHSSVVARTSTPSGNRIFQTTACGESLIEPTDLPLDAEQLLFEPDEVSEDCNAAEMLFGADAEEDGMKSLSSSQASSSMKRSSSGVDVGDDGKCTSLETIVALVDSALRLAISESPRRLTKGVNVTRTESLRRLADVFPTMWSPGYLPAVSSRAVFISTINHALQSVCGNRASRCDSARDARDLADYESNEQRLWQTLKKSLHNVEAPQRLRPTWSPEKLSGTDSKILAVDGPEGNGGEDQESIIDAFDAFHSLLQDEMVEIDFEDDQSLLSYDEYDSAHASFCEDDQQHHDVEMDEMDFLDLARIHGEPDSTSNDQTFAQQITRSIR